ncbi:MAG TPA: hypothetical protein VNZ86_00950, partial [Bacteroidia bacterium]|nr:hypothetical protein [Bacteroidia bacterium]
FARLYGLGEDRIHFNPELYASNEKTFMEVIHSLPDTYSSCFLFGHNETLSQVAASLTGNRVIQVPTCGAVILDAGSAKWSNLDEARLLLFEYPKKYNPD